MGQWVDAGNLMVEPRFIGQSLNNPKRPDLDLYGHFGVEDTTFSFFPHLKHWSFYKKPYRHLLHGNRPSAEAVFRSFEEVLALMKMNKEVEVLVVPGTWFLDPVLYEDPKHPAYSKDFVWLGALNLDLVEIGPAAEVDPIQEKFALAVSRQRRQAHQEGLYTPTVYATCLRPGELEGMLAKFVSSAS